MHRLFGKLDLFDFILNCLINRDLKIICHIEKKEISKFNILHT